jgi:hypothetical protein
LAKTITADRIVSITTPFRQAVHFFANGETSYCVLDGDRIVGVLRPSHLYAPRAVLCYFALTLDLETAALDLCTWFPDAWHALPELRQAQVKTRWDQKMKKMRQDDWADLLADGEYTRELKQFLIHDAMQCTNFIDKATMIKKSKLLIDQSNTRIDKVFSRAERVRNACVHPLATGAGHPDLWPTETRDFFQMTPAETSGFVKDCLDIIESIKAVMPGQKKPDAPNNF